MVTEEDRVALDIARDLARAGIPIFVAPPDPDNPSNKVGFRLPSRWQQTRPDPAAVDDWQPGWALCMVCGHKLDLVDLDPYSGDAAKAGIQQVIPLLPVRYAVATTPSGGIHAFIAPVGVRSMNGVLDGVDVKSGDAQGRGRGFAFLAPTSKPSKVDGAIGTYHWLTPPNLAALEQAGADEAVQRIADLVIQKRANRNGAGPSLNGNGNGNGLLTPDQFMQQPPPRESPWASLDSIKRTLAAGRNDGVMRLAASLRERNSISADEAIARMYTEVWPHIDENQGGHEFPAEEFESVIRAVWREYPGPAEHVQEAQAAVADLAANPLPGSVLELTDAYVTDRVANILSTQGYNGTAQYCWARGLNWMMWNGIRWVPVDVSEVWNEVRRYFIWLHATTANAGAEQTILGRLNALLTKARITAITDLARGHEKVVRDAGDFDAQPDLINTPNGVVNLRTGEILPHDSKYLLTKLTSGNYRPGYTHEDWIQALTALNTPEQEWYKTRIGQAITGYPPSDGIMPVLQGTGENGKSALTTDGPVRALGDYADMASHKLITAQKAGSSEHSTEMADLRGQRLLIGEELAEGRAIDVTALKRIQDVGRIKARYVHKDNITFSASHSLMCTTNYIPVISETDHGTWRRLVLLRFRYTFRKPGQALMTKWDRQGDPELKYRIRYDYSGQHDAIVTWAVEGAMAWYAGKMTSAPPTERIAKDTLAWRASSDYVLAFWNERLIADHGEPGAHPPCISASHLMEVFNAWLGQNGHNVWSKEMFANRFGGHEETTRNGVDYIVTAKLNNLSWYTDGHTYVGRKTLSKQMRVWMGVRFQNPENPADQANQSQVDEVDDPPINSPSDPSRETFPERSSTSSTSDSEEPSGSEGDDKNAVAESNNLEQSPDRSRWSSASSGPSPEPVTERNSDSPPNTEKPADSDSPQKPKKTRKTKAPKREGPDPELAGPQLDLPVVVTHEGHTGSLSLEQAAKLLEPMVELTVDVETTGYPIGHQHYALRTVQLGDSRYAIVFDATDEASHPVIRDALAAAAVLHAHSSVADLVPLELAGLIDGDVAWPKMDDTVLRAKLADPQLSQSDADGLKKLAADVLGEDARTPAANEARKKLFASGKWLMETKPDTPPERSGWAQVDPRCQTMITYAASDVLDTAALPRVLPGVDGRILKREQDLQRICARISRRGIRLDPDHTHELRDRHRTAKAEIGQQIQDTYGIENPGSAQQVAAAFAELGVELEHTDPSTRFPEGQPSTTEAVLLPHKRAGGEIGDLASIILDYRDHATALSLILEPFGIQVDYGDGRVRPTVYTLGTDTGRTSCVRPNLQQLSREGGIRACITADPGMMLISADFQAVELRTAAALSGDRDLYEMILEGDAARARGDKEAANAHDLHWKIARQVWGPQASKGDRYNAKRGVFGRLYGAGIKKIAETLGITEAEAKAVADTLDMLAPGVARWSQTMQQYARRGGRAFEAYSGRPIWLDRKYSHKAANYAIQGTAKEFLTDGLLEWDKTRWGGGVILPVHDEVLAVVPADEANDALAALVTAMTSSLSGMNIVAEPSTPSFAWQDAA